jgi:hypothetical protein
MTSLVIALPGGGGGPQNANGAPLVAPRCRRRSGECAFPLLGIGVQAIQLSPYHAGLAGRHRWRLPAAPASRACSCPLGLSPSGEPDGPETFLRVPPGCARDSAPRPAAHHISAYGSSDHGLAARAYTEWTTLVSGSGYRSSRRLKCSQSSDRSRFRRLSQYRQQRTTAVRNIDSALLLPVMP